jgi:hypothetical protein
LNKPIKVSSPKNQSIEEIKNCFWNNWLIVSERTDRPLRATVLYYCRNRTSELHSILDILDEDPEANGYPDLMYVGPSRGFIGGAI